MGHVDPKGTGLRRKKPKKKKLYRGKKNGTRKGVKPFGRQTNPRREGKKMKEKGESGEQKKGKEEAVLIRSSFRQERLFTATAYVEKQKVTGHVSYRLGT